VLIFIFVLYLETKPQKAPLCFVQSAHDFQRLVFDVIIERRPLKGFMKMYKTPPQRRRKKAADDAVAAELEAAAEVDAELSMAQAHEQRMLGCSGASINHLANNVSAEQIVPHNMCSPRSAINLKYFN